MQKILQLMNKHILNTYVHFRLNAERLQSTRFEDSLVRDARTRTLAATDYNVHASSRKMLGSSTSLCNEGQSPRPSAIVITERPRPGCSAASEF
ncbi:unnamed protein product [Sphagnum troendelagicum]